MRASLTTTGILIHKKNLIKSITDGLKKIYLLSNKRWLMLYVNVFIRFEISSKANLLSARSIYNYVLAEIKINHQNTDFKFSVQS